MSLVAEKKTYVGSAHDGPHAWTPFEFVHRIRVGRERPSSVVRERVERRGERGAQQAVQVQLDQS